MLFVLSKLAPKEEIILSHSSVSILTPYIYPSEPNVYKKQLSSVNQTSFIFPWWFKCKQFFTSLVNVSIKNKFLELFTAINLSPPFVNLIK